MLNYKLHKNIIIILQSTRSTVWFYGPAAGGITESEN